MIPLGSTVHELWTEVFNEWAKRYAKDPQAFDSLLDESGAPIADYGERCATYFSQLAAELQKVAVR